MKIEPRYRPLCAVAVPVPFTAAGVVTATSAQAATGCRVDSLTQTNSTC